MGKWTIARVYSDGLMVLSRTSVAALLALAPLMCIAFCHIVDDVHRAAPATVFRCDLFSLHHPLASPDDGRAPLSDLQQLIRAVTECAPSLSLWLTPSGILASLTVIQMSLPLYIGLQPPKPPPRFIA